MKFASVTIQTVDLQPSKALISLDHYNLLLLIISFLGMGSLFCCSFFCPLDQPSETLQTVQVAPIQIKITKQTKPFFVDVLFHFLPQ